MLLLIGSANRDEDVFEDGDRYRIGRDSTNKLVSFGGGVHFCLGAHLARLEANIALAEFAKSVRHFEVDESGIERVIPRTCGASRPADEGAGALMPRFEPNPTRRPTLVSGASSGIGEAVAYALADLGHPSRSVPAGSRRRRRSRTRSAATGERRSPTSSTSPTTPRWTRSSRPPRRPWAPPRSSSSGAGDLEFGAADQMDPASFAKQIDVHLVGAQRLAHRVLPGMRERRRGDFVLIGSDCADRQRPMMGAYDAAKAGLEAMGRQMRMELEGTGIRASIVRPGPTFTGMGMNSLPISSRPSPSCGQVGFRPPRIHAARIGHGERRRRGGGRPARCPPRPHRSPARRRSRPFRVPRSRNDPARSARVSGGLHEHGHPRGTAHRPDRPDAPRARGVRRRRGVPLVDRDVVL